MSKSPDIKGIRHRSPICIKITIMAAIVTLSFIFCSVLFTESQNLDAETSGTCGDDLVWTYDTDTGRLTITGSGEMDDMEYVENKWGGNIIRSVSLPDGLTSIGEEAFDSCHFLTSITIPDSVTEIGEYAFYKCYSLNSVDLGHVKEIDDGAFEYCYSLTTVTIPDTVTYMSDDAFNYCSALQSITIGSEVHIWDEFLESCQSLQSIEVSESNTHHKSVNGILFSKDGTKLQKYPSAKTDTSYTVPETVKEINFHAFYQSDNLRTITLGDNVETVYNSAFADCASLETINIGSGLSDFDTEGLDTCKSLKEINVSEGNTSFKSIDGVLFDSDCTKLIKYPMMKTDKSYTVPDTVVEIQSMAFRSCNNLQKITMGFSVEIIGADVFRNCKNLIAVDLNSGLTDIWERAFANCSSLKTITIPDSVNIIGDYVFRGCRSLTSITVDENNSEYTSIDGVLFTKDGTILKCYPGGKTGTSYTVPESVITVDYYAMAESQYLESITFGDNVIRTETAILDSCPNLKTVYIGSGMKFIGSSPFVNCPSLESIIVSEDNPTYSSMDGVLFRNDNKVLVAYPASKSDSEYSIPSTVKTIFDHAFNGTKNLTRLNIPSSVSVLFSRAIYECLSVAEFYVEPGCDELSSIDGVLYSDDGTTLYRYPSSSKASTLSLPDPVDYVDYTALMNAYNLQSIIVGEGNPEFSTSEGYLLSKDGVELIYCLVGMESAIIDNEIKVVNRYAFTGNMLKEVSVAEGSDVYLDHRSFYNCTSLESITIPEGASAIFDGGSIFFDDNEHHTITVNAPKGFTIPGYALNGDVEIVYSYPNESNDNGMIFLAIGVIIAAIVAIVIFVMYKRKNSSS